MKKGILGLALGVGLYAGNAFAIDFTQTGAVLSVSYNEPSQNADGSSLDDLDHTNVYFQVGSDADVKGPNVPASSVAGGAAISTSVTVPVAAGQQASVTISASAMDVSGNESPRSASITKRIDRLSPAAPK